MPQESAGVLLVRRPPAGGVELLLGHMGGPFWARKEARAWSLPKGLVEPGEEPLAAARREFAEELGVPVPEVPLAELGSFRYASGKTIRVWIAEADPGIATPAGNAVTLEWPPHSGRTASFPEIDRIGWFAPDEARRLLVAGQVPVVDAAVRWAAGR
ncbi:NUDIX domain-containing protein [Agromyces archimandritae]|uniref:NUDIX domain-containing protein n=1 Tax=Agromyces archimandritae TaxID=2781962 RepID=A0A975IPI8_9MICO|nr:NUDIX domain-containing protein [Agromyces archimandritae]QTX05645.1 NUDIX domain-containing protein [Agromyces archimandritae]